MLEQEKKEQIYEGLRIDRNLSISPDELKETMEKPLSRWQSVDRQMRKPDLVVSYPGRYFMGAMRKEVTHQQAPQKTYAPRSRQQKEQDDFNSTSLAAIRRRSNAQRRALGKEELPEITYSFDPTGMSEEDRKDAIREEDSAYLKELHERAPQRRKEYIESFLKAKNQPQTTKTIQVVQTHNKSVEALAHQILGTLSDEYSQKNISNSQPDVIESSQIKHESLKKEIEEMGKVPVGQRAKEYVLNKNKSTIETNARKLDKYAAFMASEDGAKARLMLGGMYPPPMNDIEEDDYIESAFTDDRLTE